MYLFVLHAGTAECGFNYYGKTSGFSMNAASTQSLKLLNSLSLCLIQFFNTNHQGSILLKSGDSGGKYEISNPRLATNSSIYIDL